MYGTIGAEQGLRARERAEVAATEFVRDLEARGIDLSELSRRLQEQAGDAGGD